MAKGTTIFLEVPLKSFGEEKSRNKSGAGGRWREGFKCESSLLRKWKRQDPSSTSLTIVTTLTRALVRKDHGPDVGSTLDCTVPLNTHSTDGDPSIRIVLSLGQLPPCDSPSSDSYTVCDSPSSVTTSRNLLRGGGGYSPKEVQSPTDPDTYDLIHLNTHVRRSRHERFLLLTKLFNDKIIPSTFSKN